MIRYIILKLLFTFCIIISVSFITFSLTYILPSDPAKTMLGVYADQTSVEAIRKELGIDRPLTVQYLSFLIKLSKGDFGRSYITNRDVYELIMDRLPATVKLASTSIIFSSITGVVIGTLSVLLNSRLILSFISNITVVFAAIPVFFLGLLLSLIVGSYLKLLPISGYEDGLKGVKYLILPALTLSVFPTALITRLTTMRLSEVMNSNFAIAHLAIGFSRTRVVTTFAFKNAIAPVITVIGNTMAVLFSGAFFVEYIFSWPGIGLLWVDSILRYDYPVIVGIVLFSALVFVILTTIIDFIYIFLDPRTVRA